MLRWEINGILEKTCGYGRYFDYPPGCLRRVGFIVGTGFEEDN